MPADPSITSAPSKHHGNGDAPYACSQRQQPPEAACNPSMQPELATKAAPVVPKLSKVAKKKLDYLLEAGEEITGYAIQNKDGRRGAIDCHGFVYWWQDGAPVHMPEAAGWVDDGGMLFWTEDMPPDGENIYTEQQVRQLLAAHGIK